MILVRLIAAGVLIPLLAVLAFAYVVGVGIGWVFLGQDMHIRVSYPDWR